jgi:hypothetical protein
MSRLPHLLDNQLTDSNEVFSLMYYPLIIPKKIPGTHFCYRLSKTQRDSAAGRIMSIDESNNLIGN